MFLKIKFRFTANCNHLKRNSVASASLKAIIKLTYGDYQQFGTAFKFYDKLQIII